MRGSCLSRAILLVVLGTFVYVLSVGRYPARYVAETSIPKEWVDSPDELGQDKALLAPTGSLLNKANLTRLLRCPLYPATLQGLGTIEIMSNAIASEDEILMGVKPLKLGGAWSPYECRPKQSVAIIIPYRDRLAHLRQLLKYLHPHLQRQLKEYRIFVIQQAYNDTFNKGRIMNIGFEEVMKYGTWDCVIFHDVDMIPENDHNLYMCGSQPRHLSPSLDEMRYTLMYTLLVGGALAFTPQQFRTVNGYSNLYWGWGAEDDDMAARIIGAGYKILRPAFHLGRFKMVPHKKREPALRRKELLLDWERWKYEGLLSLKDLNFKVLSRSNSMLYTNITIDIGPSPTN